MTRTYGAKDKRKRKRRVDIGKRRKRYAGKKTRTKRQIKFAKRIGNKAYIKLRPFEKRPMSKDGYMRWHKDVRGKIKPIIYKMGAVIRTPVRDITTKADIEEWALVAIGAEGDYIVMGVSACWRARKKRKWVKMFRVVIFDSPTGLRAKFVSSYRLHRYWFFKDGKKR